MPTPESPKPNTALNLLMIHRIISRALEVTLQKGHEYLATGFPDNVVRKGYHDYIYCLVTVLSSHHLTEDELVFPQLGIRIPSAPCSLLSADHQKIVILLDDIKASLDQFDEDGGKKAVGSILNTLEGLKDMWYPHIGIEESHFTQENVNQAMSGEEQIKLGQQVSRHSQEHTRPGNLVVPFLLFNLTANERKVFFANTPPIVTRLLIPHIWKKKWLPMKPFLLAD